MAIRFVVDLVFMFVSRRDSGIRWKPDFAATRTEAALRLSERSRVGKCPPNVFFLPDPAAPRPSCRARSTRFATSSSTSLADKIGDGHRVHLNLTAAGR